MAACGAVTQVMACVPAPWRCCAIWSSIPAALVTKAELRQHVWAGTHVTDTVLRVCVQEIRAALGDAAAAPQYLETVGRQGYRFLVGGDLDVRPPLATGPIVGRQREVDLWSGGSSVPPKAPANSSLSAEKRGLARRQWSICGWPAWPPGRAVRIGTGTMRRALWAKGNRTCHSWRHWAAGPWANPWGVLRCCGSMRRCGWSQLPGLVSETELERLQRQIQGMTSSTDDA